MQQQQRHPGSGQSPPIAAASAERGPSGTGRVPADDGARRDGASAEGVLELTSEFGAVSVAVDDDANGPRLRIENRQNGRVIYLDPLELASLTWLTHERLGPFLDPSQTGWCNDTGA